MEARNSSLRCERGIRTFEPATRNRLDISAVPVVQAKSHLPIIADPSHAAGPEELVVPLSRGRDPASARTVSSSTCTPTASRRCATDPQAVLGNEIRALAQAVRQLHSAVGRVNAGAATS